MAILQVVSDTVSKFQDDSDTRCVSRQSFSGRGITKYY